MAKCVAFVVAACSVALFGCSNAEISSEHGIAKSSADAGNHRDATSRILQAETPPAQFAAQSLQYASNGIGMDPQQTRSAVTMVAGLQSAVGLKRFVSLAPSNTELLYSLGAQNELVADSTQCDYPPDAKKKEHVGSFNSVNLEKLMLLHPDEIFLVNGQEAVAATLEKQNYNVAVLQNNKVSDVAKNIIIIGRATNRIKEADDAARRFNQHVQAIKDLDSSAKSQPRVFVCVWPKPLVTIGRTSYLDDAVTTCGATSISANLTTAYPTFNAEKLLINQPDFIVLPAEANTPGFLEAAPWSSLKAVKEKRYAFLPPRDDDRLSRPTLRLEDGLIWLSKKLHPDLSTQFDTLQHSWQHPDRSAKAH